MVSAPGALTPAPGATGTTLLTPKCPPLDTLAACLRDLGEPVSKRMRAIYYLRLLGTPAAIAVLSEALRERRNSQLVRHELAYVLGQMQQEKACGVLEAVLDTPDEDVMVRHEVRVGLFLFVDRSARARGSRVCVCLCRLWQRGSQFYTSDVQPMPCVVCLCCAVRRGSWSNWLCPLASSAATRSSRCPHSTPQRNWWCRRRRRRRRSCTAGRAESSGSP